MQKSHTSQREATPDIRACGEPSGELRLIPWIDRELSLTLERLRKLLRQKCMFTLLTTLYEEMAKVIRAIQKCLLLKNLSESRDAKEMQDKTRIVQLRELQPHWELS